MAKNTVNFLWDAALLGRAEVILFKFSKVQNGKDFSSFESVITAGHESLKKVAIDDFIQTREIN